MKTNFLNSVRRRMKTCLRHTLTALVAVSALAVASCSEEDTGAGALLARYASAGSDAIVRADLSALPEGPALAGALRPEWSAAVAPLLDNKAVTGPDLVAVVSDGTVMAVFGISDEDDFIGKIAGDTGLPVTESGDYKAVSDGAGTVWMADGDLGFVVYSSGTAVRDAATAAAFAGRLATAAARKPLPEETAAGLCRGDIAVLRRGSLIPAGASFLQPVADLLPLFIADSDTHLLNISFTDKTCSLSLAALSPTGTTLTTKGRAVDTGLLELAGEGQNAVLLLDAGTVFDVLAGSGIVREGMLGDLRGDLDGTCMMSLQLTPQTLVGDVSGKLSMTVAANLRKGRGADCLASLHKAFGGQYVPGKSLTVTQSVEIEKESGSYLDDPEYVTVTNRMDITVEGARLVVRVNGARGPSALRSMADAVRGSDAALLCVLAADTPGLQGILPGGLKAVVTGRDGVLHAELTVTGTDRTFLQTLLQTVGNTGGSQIKI